MSKDTPTALKNKYAEELVTLASMWRVIRIDGVEFGFTDHVEDIDYDGLTYKATTGFTRTALDNKMGLSVDNMEAHGFLDSADITEEDLVAGLYRDAQVWFFELDYTNTGLGIQKLEYGVIGRITIHDDYFEAELRSLTSLLGQEIGEKYGRYCRHTLGDSGCGVDLDPTVWGATEAIVLYESRKASTYDARRYVCTTAGTTGGTEPTWNTTVGNTTADGSVVWTCYNAYTYNGTVSGVTSKQVFDCAILAGFNGEFQYGVVSFTSGLNNGISMDVKTDAAGTITLLFPVPFNIAISDTFTISMGCNKLLKAAGDAWESTYTGHCRVKFSPETDGNAANFGGECEIPGTDSAFTVVT